MPAARSILRALDGLSHALPRGLTGAPLIHEEELDPFLHWLLALRGRRGAPPLSSLTPEEARETLRRDLIPLQAGYAVTRVTGLTVPGPKESLRARWYEPPASTAFEALVVYFHGGGFVFGDLDTHDDICRLLCRTSGAQVLSVAYRLAPEHPFPAAVEDAEAATRWAIMNASQFNVPVHRVVVAGDSAGANLAAVTAQTLALEGVRIAAQLLFYPSTDHGTPRISRNSFSNGLFLSNEDRAWFYDHYLQGAHGADPRVSPLLGNISLDIAPAIVVTAALDVLRDEGRAYAETLRKHDALLEHIEAAGLGHGFANLVGVHRTSEATVRRAAECLRANLRR